MPQARSTGAEEAPLIRASLHGFDSFRRPALKDEAAIAVERGGITLIPNSKSRWEEKHLPGASIYDLRADGKALRFECDWRARNRAETVRTDFCIADREAPDRLYFRIRPKTVPAARIVAALPTELRQPRCRACHERCPVDGTCPSCGADFGKAFRKTGLRKLGIGIAMALGGALVARVLGGSTGGRGSALIGLIMGALLLGGLTTASIGIWSLALGPRFRLFFLKWYGAVLVVLGSFALALAGLIVGVKLLR